MTDIAQLISHARAASQSKDFTRARKLLQLLLKMPIQDADHYNHAGLIAYDMGGYDQAMPFFIAAIKLNMSDPAYANNLGLVFFKKGDYARAICSFEQARRVDASYAPTYYNEALVYEAQGDYARAKELFETTIELDEMSALGWCGLAHIAEVTLYSEDIKKYAQKAIDVDQKMTEAHVILARQCRRDQAFSEALRVVSQAIDLDSHSITAWFEKGHIYHQMKQYDQAWTAFQKANALQQKNPQKRMHYETEVNAVLQVYDDLAGNALIDSTPVSSKWPVYIIGSPRSGTTLLAQMLDMHDALYSAGELHCLSAAYQQLLPKVPSQMRQYQTMLTALWHEKNMELVKMGRNFYRNELNRVLPKCSDNASQPWMIDKMPANARHLGLIARLAPGAPIIHMIRDGREVAFSAFTQNFQQDVWHSHDAMDAIYEWCSTIELAQKAADVFQLNYIQVHYERLVADPKMELKRICKFLNIPWQDTCLRFYDNKRNAQTASFYDVSQPLYSHSLKKAHYYPTIYAEMTEFAAQTLMDLGYEV